jgi:SAM-dependent methyltransferase
MPENPNSIRDQFPHSAKYNLEWVVASVSGGADSLRLTEWLSSKLDLRHGMRVLDLGCGRAVSSIFLRREFGVQVWATDLWFSASENLQRIRDAGVEDGVFPTHANARSLPFAAEFFDVIVAIDSYYYFGTDDLYLNYLARFVKPCGLIALAGAGLMQEIEGPVPAHLAEWWTPDLCCLHSANWWRKHWERGGMVDVQVSDSLPDGWQLWLEWQRIVAPENHPEIKALEADQGRYLGYVRAVARRRPEIALADPIESVPTKYVAKPLLKTNQDGEGPEDLRPGWPTLRDNRP